MIVEPEVVGEFASGSHEAFHKIFKLFYPKVYAFIRGFIKDLDDSEDLTQIVFIKLWNKRAIIATNICRIKTKLQESVYKNRLLQKGFIYE